MSLQTELQSLKDFDVNDLDFDNVGSWPLFIRLIVWLILLGAVGWFGYKFHVEDMGLRLDREHANEQTLKQDFEAKAFQAANLAAYKSQMIEMEESFGALVSQLPSDTEVPGLLEDITNKGVLNGLEIGKIDLLPEETKEFYIELPIAITAKGSYHDLGAFISGMAGLPRIVTLHSFTIASPSVGDSANLMLSITAKTYRYKDEGS